MTEQAQIGTWERDGSGPQPEHRRLEVFIGKWINEGETIATPHGLRDGRATYRCAGGRMTRRTTPSETEEPRE